MELIARLEESVGDPIDAICPNNFHSRTSNHCAHYVSHLVGLSFGFNCVQYKGGTGEQDNIRVHEIFVRCPKVGRFAGLDTSRAQLVFVTRKNNVDLGRKWMGNIPEKHIGIFCQGHIYHYSSTANAVSKWTPERFLSVFQNAYRGDQGLYFGTIPGEDILLDVDPTGNTVEEGRAFELSNAGRNWFAKERGKPVSEQFFVGREVRQEGPAYFGIHQPAGSRHGERFRASDYFEEVDQWAVLLELTGHCESGNYLNVVNTYDRAKFTFGFYQLAAHTPDDNLILLFRELLRLPQAALYFPELKLINDQVHRVKKDGGTTNLETVFEGQLQFFMNFLNPLRVPIDEQEILSAGRMMHWTAADPLCRRAQIRVSAELLQRKMSRRYSRWYDLDGATDTICAIIADIHHQGRASKKTVREALAKDGKEAELLTINKAYGSRNARLTAKVTEMKVKGELGKRRYDACINECVAI